MVDSKGFAGSTHAAHYFIGDEQDIVAAAYFRDPLDITVGWRDSAERGSHHRLKNEGSDILRSLALEQAVEFIGAIDIAGWVFETKRAAVAIAGRNMSPLLQHWGKRLAATNVARNRKGAERRAMVALGTRNDPVALLFASLDPVLSR